MNKIFYVIFFIIHILIYYKAFHQLCIEKTNEYLEINEEKSVENLPEHFDHNEWVSHLYELMKEEWVKEILYPLSVECDNDSKKCIGYNENKLIPYDKLIKKETHQVIDGDINTVADFYVEDQTKNMIKLNINELHLEKPIYVYISAVTPAKPQEYTMSINPFCIVNCIAQWERYTLNKLSRKCFRPPHNAHAGQHHTHSLDIILDIIYPRYLHYKLISYNNK